MFLFFKPSPSLSKQRKDRCFLLLKRRKVKSKSSKETECCSTSLFTLLQTNFWTHIIFRMLTIFQRHYLPRGRWGLVPVEATFKHTTFGKTKQNKQAGHHFFSFFLDNEDYNIESHPVCGISELYSLDPPIGWREVWEDRAVEKLPVKEVSLETTLNQSCAIRTVGLKYMFE